MRWFGDWMDPELEELFRDDPSLKQTAQLLHASRPEAAPDPHFRNRLRAQLMQEAALRPAVARQPKVRTVPRPFWMRLGPVQLAWGGAAAGTALIAATVLTLVGQRSFDHQTQITYSSPVAAQHLVSPSQAIEVSFNQPMNHLAVEAGLHIEPATEVTTSWQGNNLVITPVHHLAGNTPYTVTIAKPALVAASGATAAAPVQITFGTAPTPPPAPITSALPQLTTTTLGVAQSGSAVLFAPGGSVVSTSGSAMPGATTPPATASPSASASPSSSPATPAATPSASASASASAAPSAAPATTAPSLVEFQAGQKAPLVLGVAASAAAFSADGSSLAAAVPDGHGGSDIVVSRSDGSHPATLSDSPAPVVALTWTADGAVEYATAAAVQSVDASGAVTTLATPSASVVTLAPGGAYAYVAPTGSAPGQLLKLADTSTRPLAGTVSGSAVAFSGDGGTVAWIATSSSQQQLMTEPVTRDSAAAVSVLDPGSSLSLLALNHDGSEVTYDETLGDGSTKLVLAQVPSGTPLATGPAASAATFSPDGSALALLVTAPDGVRVQLAAVPGGTRPHPVQTAPAPAVNTLHAFVDAQTTGNAAALRSLSAGSVDATGSTPTGLSRANIVDAVAESDGTLDATVELIIDPSGTRSTALVADETLTVSPAGSGYLVSALQVSQLHPQEAGPHVVRLSSAPTSNGLLIQLSFDSDLNAATVPAAISVVSATGPAPLPISVVYDADTRTAWVTVSGASSGTLTVTASSALRDVDGQALATAFSGVVRPAGGT